jgi:hypothetical protein
LLLDPTFLPVPLAAHSGEQNSPETATIMNASVFALRGTIEAENIATLPNIAEGTQIFADPKIETITARCSGKAYGTHYDVAKLLDVKTLHSKSLTGKKVAVAIVDGGVNIEYLKTRGLNPNFDKTISWAPDNVSPNTPGEYEIGHGTMCAFDALITAPECTLLDFPVLLSETEGGSVMAGFLSDALVAFSYLRDHLTSENWKYTALVVNNSWGMFNLSWDFPKGHPGRYADNPNHPFNLMVGTLARSGADIVFAAGNCGADCPDGRCEGAVKSSIMGANAHPDVLTVAGCDIDDERVGYSSQGPAISGMGQNKPDLTSYTHFYGSGVSGAEAPDSGTSAASPVAAGCIAAIRTRLPATKISAKDLFKQFVASAKPRSDSDIDWNNDYGGGIIRPVPVATHYNL